jgi:Domain of unknown function (DUF5658)
MMNLSKLLAINVLLQVFDGTASYFVLSRGEWELAPLIKTAIDGWGLLWVLVCWKIFLCALLVLLYSLRRYRTNLSLHGLTFAAVVYGYLGINLVLRWLRLA